MRWMPYIPEFIRLPLLCAMLVGLALSLLSIFVVARRWAFLSVGVSHAAFLGIALAYLIDKDPIVCAFFVSILCAFLIGFGSRSSILHEDTVIGIIFSTFMGLGIILFSFSKGYLCDVFSYLFGNLLAVSRPDLNYIVFVSVIDILFIMLFSKPLILATIDEEFAHSRGLPVDFLYYSLLLLLTITVVVGVKIVGVLLVTSLVIVPASVAQKFFTSLKFIFLSSVFLGIFLNLLGIYISYIFDLPPGATIATLAGFTFLLTIPKRG